MKQLIFLFIVLLAMSSCNSKPQTSSSEKAEIVSESCDSQPISSSDTLEVVADSCEYQQLSSNDKLEVKLQDTTRFNVQYQTIMSGHKFFERVELTDSLDILWFNTWYNAENNNGGSGYLIAIPKDTTYSKIYNYKRFSQSEWEKLNKLIESHEQAISSVATSDMVENYYDVYLFYFKQEYLYAAGGMVDDNGVEWPDWGPKDNAPLEVYKLQNGHWEFQYIHNRTRESADQYGRSIAKEILKERFGKMAEEMEREKHK